MHRAARAAGHVLGLAAVAAAIAAGGVALYVLAGLLAWALSIALAGVWM